VQHLQRVARDQMIRDRMRDARICHRLCPLSAMGGDTAQSVLPTILHGLASAHLAQRPHTCPTYDTEAA
jgi:hypothetical protein